MSENEHEAMVPRESYPCTSECVWFERQRSLASISSDSLRPSSNPSISHYLTPHYLTHAYTFAGTAGMWPAAASKPSNSFICIWIDRQSHQGPLHQLLAKICCHSIHTLALKFASSCYIIYAVLLGVGFHWSAIAGGVRDSTGLHFFCNSEFPIYKPCQLQSSREAMLISLLACILFCSG